MCEKPDYEERMRRAKTLGDGVYVEYRDDGCVVIKSTGAILWTRQLAHAFALNLAERTRPDA